MDISTLIPWILNSLNANTAAALFVWSVDELYHSAAEALGDIAGRFLLIVAVDDSIALVTDQALYELPDLHIATIAAFADGTILAPSNVAELEAFDDNWEEAAGATPTRWIGNALGSNFIRLYRQPGAGGVLTLIFQQDAPDVTAAAPEILIPAPVGDYLALKALEQARLRQGDAQVEDAAAAFGSLGGIYEMALEGYFGNGS